MKDAGPRPGKLVLVWAALAALAFAGTDAWAKGGGSGGGHGGRSGHSGGKSSHGGSKSGAHHPGGAQKFHGSRSSGFYGSYWAGPAYWLGSGVAYQPAQTVYYIERSEEELRTDSTWFYCENDAAYYPYVRNCPGGWVMVAPFTVP